MALAINSQMPTSAGAFATNSASLSYSFNNVGGGLVVIEAVIGGHGFGATPVTYAGASVGAADVSRSWFTADSIAGIFHKLSAATGSQTVVVTANALTNAIMSGCISFTGHDTTNPIKATFANDNGGPGLPASTPATVNVTGTSVGNIIVDCCGTGGGTGGGILGFGQTLSWLANVDTLTAGDNSASSTAAGTGGTVTMSYQVDPDQWGIVAAEIAAQTIFPVTFATKITGQGRFSGTTLTFPGVLDFGDPGSNEAQLVITGQTGILAGSQVEAWIQAEDYGGLRTGLDMTYASQSIGLTCGSIVPGVGFTIYGRCLQKMQGRFKVRWFWV